MSSPDLESGCRAPNGTGPLCSGKGRCHCGRCSCSGQSSGPLCDCDDAGCERHEGILCGGSCRLWEKGGLRVVPRVFRVWELHGTKGKYRRFWGRSRRCLAHLGGNWMHGHRPALGGPWWHVMPIVCGEYGCQPAHGSAPGFGRCQCGVCQCYANRTGRACECSMDTDSCISPDGKFCSGQGHCKCNRCQCRDGYFGALCEQCPGCQTSCERHR